MAKSRFGRGNVEDHPAHPIKPDSKESIKDLLGS